MNVPRIPSATMAPTERFWCAEHSGYPELYKEDICICLCRVYVISYRVCPFTPPSAAPLGSTGECDHPPIPKAQERSRSKPNRYYKAFCESASHPIPSGPRPGSDGLKDICHPPGSATVLSAPLALSFATHSGLWGGHPTQIALITFLNKHCIFHYIGSSVGIPLNDMHPAAAPRCKAMRRNWYDCQLLLSKVFHES